MSLILRPGLPPSLRLALWGTIGALLALPALAMQFTAEVNWSAEDFLAAAVLLGLTGFAIEALGRSGLSRRAAIGGAIAVLASLALIWAELAVGLFH